MIKKMLAQMAIIRVKLFSLRDLRSLIIIIILVSASFTFLGSFLLGLTQTNFLSSNDDDIFVIRNSQSSTPFTGLIPNSLADDVKNITGVIGASPEILGLLVIKDRDNNVVTFRGITTGFLDVTNNYTLEGDWFYPLNGYSILEGNNKEDISNTTLKVKMFSVVVGSSLARLQNLKIGDELTIGSTLAPVTVRVFVSGIFTSNTPLDKEMFIPLESAREMAGLPDNYINIIRVKVDQINMTIDSLKEIFTIQFTIVFRVKINELVPSDNINLVKVSVYDRLGEYKTSKYINEDNLVNFTLDFGRYFFIADYNGSMRSKPLDIFVFQNINTPIDIKLERKTYNITVNLTNNKKPLRNLTVTLTETFHRISTLINITDRNGVTTFSNLIKSTYKLRFNFSNYQNEFLLEVDRLKTFNINLNTTYSLTIYNATTKNEIIGGKLQLIPMTNYTYFDDEYEEKNSTIIDSNYVSGEKIELNYPGIYYINYTIDKWSREWYANITVEGTEEELYIGNGLLTIIINDENNERIANANITVFNDDYIISKLSNIDGKGEFLLPVGNTYIININYSNSNRKITYQLLLDKPQLLNIDLVERYKLNIFTYNGTLKNKTEARLADCLIKIFDKNNTLIANNYTDNNGYLTVELPNPGIYFVEASCNNYLYHSTIIISQIEGINQINIPLGLVRVIIKVATSTGTPIKDATITFTNREFTIKELITPSNGQIETYLEVGQYNVTIEYNNYEKIMQLDYKSSMISKINVTINFYGSLKLIFVDTVGRKIPGIQITVINEHYHFLSYSGLTDKNGIVQWNDLPWGDYSLNLELNVRNKVLTRTIKIIHIEKMNEVIITLNFDTYILSNYLFNYNYNYNTLKIDVVESNKYFSSYFSASLKIVNTVIIAFVIVALLLVLLSIFPSIYTIIKSHKNNLKIIQTLGTSRNQLLTIIIIKFVYIVSFASIIGSIVSFILIVSLNKYLLVNIGGLIINPKIDINSSIIVIIVIVTIILITIVKTQQSIINIMEINEPKQISTHSIIDYTSISYSTMVRGQQDDIRMEWKRKEESIFVIATFFSISVFFSIIGFIIEDWSDPRHDIYRYSKLADKILLFFNTGSYNDLRAIIDDNLSRRILLPLIMSIIKYFLGIDYFITSVTLSFISSILSMLMLKKINELIIKKNTNVNNDYRYLSVDYPELVVIVFISSTIFIRSILTPATDMIALFFLLSSMWIYLRELNREKPRNRMFFLSILIALLGTLVREVVFLIIFIYLVFLVKVHKNKILYLLITGTLLLLFYLLTIDFTIFNVFLKSIHIPSYSGDIVSWLNSTSEIIIMRWKNIPLDAFITSIAPLLMPLFILVYRFKNKDLSLINNNKINTIIICLLILWALFYELMFILFWNFTFVQRFWLFNCFVIFQLTIIPSKEDVELKVRNGKQPITNNISVFSKIKSSQKVLLIILYSYLYEFISLFIKLCS